MLAFLLALLALAVLILWDPLKLFDNPRTVLARAIAWARSRLVDDARNFWRWWSVRLNALGLGILGFVQIDPVGALSIWNMMPAHVRAVLPPNFLAIAGMALFGLSMLARIVKQKPKGVPDAK